MAPDQAQGEERTAQSWPQTYSDLILGSAQP